MPPTLQAISHFSPMSWGLEACNDLFLRNANTAAILPNIFRLVLFGVALLVLSFWIYKSRTNKG
ncbi:MAG: hypothetical protein U0T32_02445 [Chitinophagales bacterium]